MTGGSAITTLTIARLFLMDNVFVVTTSCGMLQCLSQAQDLKRFHVS